MVLSYGSGLLELSRFRNSMVEWRKTWQSPRESLLEILGRFGTSSICFFSDLSSSFMAGYSVLKRPGSFGHVLLAFEMRSNSPTSIHGNLQAKCPIWLALVAPLVQRAIVVEMALIALGQGSLIRLPFACPYVVDFGDILPFEGLLLVTMVVSG
ncbi:hypothetical protein Tco_0965941 [Tanacetum coccineum]